jgi:hypothetical protein
MNSSTRTLFPRNLTSKILTKFLQARHHRRHGQEYDINQENFNNAIFYLSMVTFGQSKRQSLLNVNVINEYGTDKLMMEQLQSIHM